ncbi:Radical SAM superfamily protein [Aquisphaera giovannonii]|uniref:Radical SAM superfamily protein n=1 Tax=Aquisphaera giovannonii TaxID=406548 RepID=A0A5B9WDK9_9BACT|nr:radical SAM protein [Aquisphaera giovannonii]QEH38706.1 Radical SAM superfamily protein [Aquisphaera giovannonii]
MDGTVGDLLDRARMHYRSCGLCEHRCGADRESGGRGPCRAGTEARVFKHRVEYGEEWELVPSHLFYLSGCDLRCAFCVAGVNAFDARHGRPLTAEFLGEAVREGRSLGARTLQWVGGEPTIHLPAILGAMAACSSPLPPIVWKSDFHGTPEAFALLDGVADVYLADFKFGDDACARRIAGIDDYLRIVTRNLKIAAGQGRLIVRHLLLPGHFACCFRPIVGWMKANLPDAGFSVRDGYLPSWKAASHPELARPLGPGEGDRARELAQAAGLRVIE